MKALRFRSRSFPRPGRRRSIEGEWMPDLEVERRLREACADAGLSWSQFLETAHRKGIVTEKRRAIIQAIYNPAAISMMSIHRITGFDRTTVRLGCRSQLPQASKRNPFTKEQHP